MINKIIHIIFVSIILSAVAFLSITPTVFAADTTPVDTYLHPFTYGKTGETTSTKIGIVQNIATSTGKPWQETLGSIIKLVLAFTGAIAFISFTYAGIMMVIARGNEEEIGKAKMMIFWSIIALTIIATSYALVLGISNLKFQ